jgi:hypothetical protein
MVLGGNVPDKYIEHALLDAGLSNDNKSEAESMNNSTTSVTDIDSNDMPTLEGSDSKSKAA